MKNEMITGFKKIVFLWKKPRIVLITGNNEKDIAETISDVIKEYFQVKIIEREISVFDFFRNKVLIFKANPEKSRLFEFLLSKSKLPILVLSGAERDFSKSENITKLIRSLSVGFLVLGPDNGYFREIKKESKVGVFSFGFQNKTDFWVTDIKMNSDTNFKINYRGNIVPFWLRGIASNEKICSALIAASIGELMGLNLIKTSEALKEV